MSTGVGGGAGWAARGVERGGDAHRVMGKGGFDAPAPVRVVLVCLKCV